MLILLWFGTSRGETLFAQWALARKGGLGILARWAGGLEEPSPLTRKQGGLDEEGTGRPILYLAKLKKQI